jgi:hypothetical protein
MRPVIRLVGIIFTLVVILAAAMPAAAASPIEDYARVIRSRHAGATFSQIDGCTQTEVFVSAMDAVFGSRPGPVNKQGLVGVFYRELDVCGEPGPKGFPVVFQADAQSLDRLVTSSRFTTAAIHVALNGMDGDGNPVELTLDLEWTAIEPLQRSRVSGNGWFPVDESFGAHVHTFSHGLSAAAAARGTITVDGDRTELHATTDATLEQVRYFCQVIQHPRGGFDVDC